MADNKSYKLIKGRPDYQTGVIDNVVPSTLIKDTFADNVMPDTFIDNVEEGTIVDLV